MRVTGPFGLLALVLALTPIVNEHRVSLLLRPRGTLRTARTRLGYLRLWPFSKSSGCCSNILALAASRAFARAIKIS